MRRAVKRSSNRCDPSTVERKNSVQHGGRLDDALDNEPSHSLVDDLAHGASVEGEHRVPQVMASILTSPNGSGQSIGKIRPKHRRETCPWRARRLRKIAVKVDRVDRDYYYAKIEPLLHEPGIEYIGQRQAAGTGHGDRAIDTLLRKDSAEKARGILRQ